MLPAAVAATVALSLAASPRDLALPAGFNGLVAAFAFTPDGRGLVATDVDGFIARWDLAAGTAARTAARTARLGPYPTRAAPEFAVAPGGRHVAVGTATDPPRVFDLTGKPVATLPRPLPDADAWFPAFSGDGTRVVFGYERGHGSPVPGPAAVPVWDVAADRAIGTVDLPIPPGGMVSTRLALSADGSRLAAVTTPAPGNQGSGTELGVWDVATGKRIGTRILAQGLGTTLTFLPDGRSLLAADATWIAVWDPAGDRWRRADRSDGDFRRDWDFCRLVLAPDGRTFLVPVLSKKDHRTHQYVQRYAIFETATLRERSSLPTPAGSTERIPWFAGAFRPDGRVVAIDRGIKVRLFDLAGDPRAAAADLWAALAGPAPEAGAAVWALVRQPDVAVALAREKLRPAAAAGPDPATTAALIRQLDAPGFADREAARKQLAAVTRLVEPELRAAHAAATSPEQKERLAALLAATDKLTPDELRQVRTVEVLERIGTQKAAEIVRKLASGAGNAVLTREAKGTLARMAK